MCHVTRIPRVIYVANQNVLAPVDGGALKRAVVASGLAACAELFLVLVDSPMNADGTVALPTGGGAWAFWGADCTARAIDEVDPDVVVLDHVSYFDFLKHDRIGRKLIVNTQNFESQLAWEARRTGGVRAWVNAGRSTARLWRQERRAFAAADQIWFVSSDDEKNARRAHRIHSPSAIIPNVVSENSLADRRIAGAPGSAFFLGSLNYWANDLAIREIGTLSRHLTRRDAVHVIDIIGSGEPGPATRHLPPEVRVRGFVKDLRPALESYDVCLAPITAGGGTKTKILEAMAAGRPVLTTRKGVQGIPEAADDVNVVIRELGADFVEAAIRLLQDSALRDRIGSAGLAMVKRNYTSLRATDAIARALLAVSA